MFTPPPRYLARLAQRTEPLHEALHNTKVFIAGSTGFFGSWFHAYFAYLRDTVGVNVEVKGGSRRTGWDIMDETTYIEPFQSQADYTIHCAGDPGTMLSVEHGLASPHYRGLLNLYKGVVRADGRLLYVSSGAVEAASSTSIYARVKGEAEWWLQGITTENAVIVRPHAVIGPGMDLNGHFAIASFLRNARANQPLVVSVQPCYRSFAHVTDFVAQALFVMVWGRAPIIYDTGSDDVITVERAAQLIAPDLVTRAAPDQTFVSNVGSSRYSANLTRIQGEFNLELDYSSEAAILDTRDYYLSPYATP